VFLCLYTLFNRVSSDCRLPFVGVRKGNPSVRRFLNNLVMLGLIFDYKRHETSAKTVPTQRHKKPRKAEATNESGFPVGAVTLSGLFTGYNVGGFFNCARLFLSESMMSTNGAISCDAGGITIWWSGIVAWNSVTLLNNCASGV
jgi:hypothetical protein